MSNRDKTMYVRTSDDVGCRIPEFEEEVVNYVELDAWYISGILLASSLCEWEIAIHSTRICVTDQLDCTP